MCSFRKDAACRTAFSRLLLSPGRSESNQFVSRRWFRRVLANHRYLFSFKGRINRALWWVHYLSVVLILVGMGATQEDSAEPSGLLLLLFTVLFIPFIWIGLAVQVKRWHDRNKSGGWVLLPLLPIIGGLWALIELGFLKGTNGDNEYGPASQQIKIVQT